MSLTAFYDIATGEIGTLELAGPSEHNPKILQYLDCCDREVGGNLGSWALARDETPWCSAFCCWVVSEAGCQSCRDARAVAWLDWGISLEAPERGCIAVIRRKRRGKDARTGSSSGNHVAFVDDFGDGWISLLGGNQRDSVKISRYSLNKYTVLGYRAPSPDYWQAPTAA